MTKLVSFSVQRNADEEAAEWLVRARKGLSPEDLVRREEWLREPRNRAAFEELSRLWKDMDALTVLADVFPLQDAHPAPRPMRVWPRLAAVATVCCLMLAGLMLFVERERLWPATIAVSPTPEVYATAVGQNNLVHLKDGSVVRLNTDSELEIVYTPTERNLFLRRGEANFEVAKDLARPFNVRVGSSRIVQAVGTAFNVRLRAANTFEVTVTEGTVKLLAEEAAVASSGATKAPRTKVEGTVAARETATVGAQAAQVRPLQPNELEERTAWQRGVLIFRGEPLSVVLEEFGRYTTTQFVLADESLGTVRVGGYFPVGEVDDLLIALRENFQITSQRDADGRIVLKHAEH